MQYNPSANDRSGEILAGGQAATAQMDAATNVALTNQLSQSFGSVVSAYANYQGEKAKAKAYGGFLDQHGEQLGIKPEWIESYKKMPFREQIASAEFLTGGIGNQLMMGNYLDKKQQNAMDRLNALNARSAGGEAPAAASRMMGFSELGANPELNYR